MERHATAAAASLPPLTIAATTTTVTPPAAAAAALPQNDVITLPSNVHGAPLVRLAISFALAQSTKLFVLEERVAVLAEATRRLPATLAQAGKVCVDALAALPVPASCQQQQERGPASSLVYSPHP